MDNNFNQQQVPQQQVPQQQVPVQQVPVQQNQNQMPAQPVYQQQAPMQQQVPAQPVYQQQAPMQQQNQNQNQMPAQPVYQPVQKQPANVNVMELIALICSAVGLLMAMIGTMCYCSCSASATFEAGSDGYTNSAVMIVAILGVLVAVAGVVLAILALKKTDAPVKAGKLSYVAAAVGIFAVLYGIIPTITICGYNCSLNNAQENYQEEMATKDYSGYFGF